MDDKYLRRPEVIHLIKSLGCAVLPSGRIVDTFNPQWSHLHTEGIGVDALSGEVDKDGPSSLQGGSPYSGTEPDQLQPTVTKDPKIRLLRMEGKDNHAVSGACPFCGSKKFGGLLPTDFESQHCSKCGRVVVTHDSTVSEADVLAYSGSGPITMVDPNPSLPWDRGGSTKRRRVKVRESEGYMIGHPVDATLTGRIQILVTDSTNLRVHAPFRILEQVEAYKFFEQFQFLLPRTPMLNAAVMDSIARWWRGFAVTGDLLEIDCTTGYSTVTNRKTNNIYSLGCLGTMPTYS